MAITEDSGGITIVEKIDADGKKLTNEALKERSFTLPDKLGVKKTDETLASRLALMDMDGNVDCDGNID